jgi:peroxiredoxin
VLVGFLGKVFGPIGFLGYAWMGWLPWHFGWVNVTNDLIWLVPFALILYGAFRHHQNTGNPAHQTLSDALQHFADQHGTTLSALSHQKPVFLVFLRHFGCTFCREAVADLRQQQTALAARGVQLAFAHMGTEAQAKAFFKAYEMDAYPRFSDPACVLYEAFDLQRATFGQAFGWQAWWRGLQVGLWQGKGVGLPVGDGFRMPGIFVIDKGIVVKEYRHRHVAERPDYQDFCTLDTPAPTLAAVATKEL